ncbi:MAG TPA: alpha/beta family hydrolase [Aeromicrobium sp.]|nr:alpha/beta family hydrolase [Aeromicrobium sp.]
MRLEIETARGLAWADVDEVGGTSHGENRSSPWGKDPRALLLLGHGAGGTVEAPDVVAARDAALSVGVSVARVTQPYRVAGRRGMPPHPTLEQPWLAVAAALAERYPSLPQIFGGRSAGARVACRTAEAGHAISVICLAYPVHPPGKPDMSRLDELNSVRVPVLVIQGDRDAFGIPPRRRGRTLVVAEGADHSLKKGLNDVNRGVTRFLRRIL